MTIYESVKAFHLISFISWFAMLFYLPRLYVYHVENRENSGFVEVVKVMEYKLFKYIGIPAMLATLLSGGYLTYITNGLSDGWWLHLKIAFVATLTCFHIYLGIVRKRLEKGECSKSGKFFRILNEYPTIVMIVVVILVVFKSF